MTARRAVDYLRLFRAQTAPATILLILVPFLHGGASLTQALIVGLYAVVVHWISFGMNSLHDYVGGWDKADPSKAHHPLCAGRITVEDAIKVIHWSLPLVTSWGALMTVWLSPSPVWSLVGLWTWYAWGMSYNLGLSKVSLLGFLPISVCFTGMAAWAWLLSSPELGFEGWTWLGYVFCTILFQISWSGHLKELEVKERSNILVRMGARVEGGVFHAGGALYYAWAVKIAGLLLGYMLLRSNFEVWRAAWFCAFGAAAVCLLHRLTKARRYDRPKELMNMSLEEIATIYVPLLLLSPLEAVILASFGVAYFILVNRALWETPYPRV